MWSETLRWALRKYYDVEVGICSYGPCLLPGRLPPGTRVGSYCSFAEGITVLRRNHPIDRISQHPLFFNHRVGLLSKDNIHSIQDNPLSIGNDVWIGHGVIIAPSCKAIGDSSIIASGAVVTKDVPGFCIAGGVPARKLRDRLSQELQREISELRWWDRDVARLAESLPEFTKPVSSETIATLRERWSASRQK